MAGEAELAVYVAPPEESFTGVTLVVHGMAGSALNAATVAGRCDTAAIKVVSNRHRVGAAVI